MPADVTPQTFATQLTGRRWLSKKAFEIRLSRPRGFSFTPGQFVRFFFDEDQGASPERDYSLTSTPSDPDLGLLVRDTGTGRFSTRLGTADVGTALDFTGPRGYFTYQQSGRTAVLVATGTGLAPFVSMARSGASGFVLLHGVQTESDLYYETLFRSLPCRYVPCLSVAGAASACPDAFQGRVTEYLASLLAPGQYDFYLCGRREMIREATLLIDERFPGGRVYSETFY